MEKDKITPEEIAKNIATAKANNVHIDVAVNPFIEKVDRPAILEKKEQDPEWD